MAEFWLNLIVRGGIAVRKPLLMLALVAVGSSAFAAPPLKPKPPAAVVKKALLAAGRPATDREVSAAYPRFILHPDNPPAPWFVLSTDDGCLYYDESPDYDPPAKVVAGIMHDHFHVKWTGSPCQPGKFISGHGTLECGDANTSNTAGGYRDDDYNSLTGTMRNGVFNGMVHRIYSWDEAQTRLIAAPMDFEMFGGCSNLDPRKVMRGFQMCQPRLP